MLFMQPANCTPGPQAIKTFCTLNVGTIVKGTITGKYAIMSKNAGHEPECREFIRQEMNRITEESGICILDEIGEVGCFSLKEIDFHLSTFCLHLFHTLLGATQRLC